MKKSGLENLAFVNGDRVKYSFNDSLNLCPNSKRVYANLGRSLYKRGVIVDDNREFLGKYPIDELNGGKIGVKFGKSYYEIYQGFLFKLK